MVDIALFTLTGPGQGLRLETIIQVYDPLKPPVAETRGQTADSGPGLLVVAAAIK